MLTLLHRWLGITTGFFLLVISLSGFALLWMNEYLAWKYPSLPENVGLIAPSAQIIGTLLLTSPSTSTSTAEPRILSLGLPTASRPFYHGYLSDGRQRIFHPETGVPLADWTWTDAAPVFLFEVHARLLAGETGHLLVGIIGILCLLSIPSGLMLWISRRRQLKLRFVLPTGLSRGQLLKSHAAQGVVLCLLLLTTSVTGIAMVFPDPFRQGLNGMLGVKGQALPQIREIASADGEVDWQQILTSAQREFPEAHLRFLTPPRSATSPVSLRLKMPEELHPNGRTYLTLHPFTAKTLERIDATTRGFGPAVFDAFYPIHSGKTEWPGHRLLLAIMALSLIYLITSGIVLYLGRKRAKVTPSFLN